LKHLSHYTLKNAVFFNPILGQIWTNPNAGLKNAINPTAGFVQSS